LRILLDMDGVLCNMLPVLLQRLNEKYNTTVAVEDICEWDIHKFFPELTAEQVYAPFAEPGFFNLDFEPVEGALEGVSTLKDLGHEIVIVTSCGAGKLRDKELWFKRVFGKAMSVKDVKFVGTRHKYLVQGDVLVDDHVDNLEAYKQHHPEAETICFDHPYNKRWIGRRALCWPDALTLITGYALMKGVH